MTTVRELCNTPADLITIMEMWVDGKKIAEDNISDMTCQELGKAIKRQEMQGREWTYKTIPSPK